MGRPFKVQPTIENSMSIVGVDVSGKSNIPSTAIIDVESNQQLSDPIPGLPDKPTFRVSEVAMYFDVSERTVYLWIENGHLAIEYTPAGQKRITRESINSCRFKPKKHVNNLPDSSQDS